MQFVNPVFLFGLSAILIPVIIHLFNFRRFRKVYFTNVRFLKQLKQETQKRSKLRHLIILALRILAIASLVIAFAQPYIPFKSGQAPIASSNAVSIFVDNSFSMEAVGSAGTLLDEAKQKAREIVAAFRPSDQFQLLTNDFEGRHQHYLTRDEFLTMLEEVKPGPVSRKLPEILSRQADLLVSSPSSRKSAFIISDFQATAYKQTQLSPPAGISVYFAPLTANRAGNVYIDSCWFDLPLQQAGQTAVMNVRVANKSASDLEKIPLKLDAGGVQRAVASIDLKAGASEDVKIPFTNRQPGLQQGFIEVTDYPVTYDDKFFFSYSVTSSIKALSINGSTANRFISALFDQDSTVSLTNQPEKLLDYGRLSSFDLILLNELPSVSSGLSQELARFVDNGGTLAVVPAGLPDLVSYNAFLSAVNCPGYQGLDTADMRVTSLNMESHLFRDVFEKTKGSAAGNVLPENTELPSVFRSFPLLNTSRTQTRTIMKLMNGRDFLTCTRSGKGQVYQFIVPLAPEFTDFPRQALFVPVLYNIALDSRPPQQLYETAGTSESILINHIPPEGDRVFKLRSLAGDFEMIPEHHQFGSSTSINLNGEVDRAGNYVLMAGTDTIAGLSFNYSRDESDLYCLNNEELEKVAGQAGIKNYSILKTDHKPLDVMLKEMNFGKQLWKYFVWLALLFLLAEVSLLRLWKY